MGRAGHLVVLARACTAEAAWTFWDTRFGGTGPARSIQAVPGRESVAKERERKKLRAMTEASQSCTPLRQPIGRLNRHLKGWGNYFSYGHACGAWWEPDWFVRSRSIGHLQPCFGLVLLHRLSRKGSVPPDHLLLVSGL
jgi:hypothetical protein